jgi:CRISPR system Cascade subunit CasE
MVWLTRVQLNLTNTAVRVELRNAVRMHQRVMSLMPGELGDSARRHAGLLYRIDEDHCGTNILIQSTREPNLTAIPPTYGHTAVRDLTPLLEALEPGLPVRYRLVGNAVKRAGRTSATPGKLVALDGEEIPRWWTTRAPGCGLHLETFDATPVGYISGHRPDTDPNNRVRHAITRYDGIATITDPQQLRRAVHEGVGRGKSHGCGLLSLAPTR